MTKIGTPIERKNRAAYLRRLRKEIKTAGAICRFPPYRLQALRHVYNARDFGAIFRIMTDHKLRGSFKIKMRREMIVWLRDPAPRYRKPLTPKQLQFIY